MALIVFAIKVLNALDVVTEIYVKDPVVASGKVMDDTSSEWEQPAKDLT